MKKETKTKLLVALAVLAVWIYIEIEPVLSQNGGQGIFNQAVNTNQQNSNSNFNNQQNLIPDGFLGDGVRSQIPNQGMPSMPLNGQPLLPRRSTIQGTQAIPPNQGFGNQQLPFMPTNNQFQNQNMGNMMPPQQNNQGMLQNLFNQRRQQAPVGQMPQNNMQQGMGNARINQALSAVQRELSIATSAAGQAEAFRSRAISERNRGAKRRAAEEARYFANQARAAASRAQSKSMGLPQVMPMVTRVRTQASRAQSAADSASANASGW